MKVRIALTAGLVLLVVAPQPVRAQDASARAQAADLFDQAREDMGAGRHAEACPKFEESLRLDPQIGTRLNLANCYEQLGRVASAWAVYTEAGEVAKLAEDRAYAQEAAARLKPRVPRIEVVVASPVDGLEVKLDGTTVTPSMPRAVDPGTHVVEAQAPGRTGWSEQVVAEEGKLTTVDVPVLEAPVVVTPVVVPTEPEPEPEPPAVTQQPARAGRPARAWIGLGLASLGGVVLGVGTWAAIDARSKGDDARELGCVDDLSSCPSAGLPVAQAAYARANLSTGLVLGGLAAITTGAILWLISPAPEAAASVMSVTPAPGGVDVSYVMTW